MSAKWYVLRSKTHKEAVVVRQIQAHGIEWYLPTLKSRSRRAKDKAFFPGYLFIRVDLQELSPSILQWLPHSLGLLTFADIPATVSDEVIEEIKQQVAALNGGMARQRPQLAKGSAVQVRSGLFAGYEGIFDIYTDGFARARVLVKMLNERYISMRLDVDQLEPLTK